MRSMHDDSGYPAEPMLPGEIDAVFENGVLRPVRSLALPERTRLRIAIRSIGPSAADRQWGREEMGRIRRQGLLRLDGAHLTRDQMHERD